jgi:1,5-anhydro-D-fructose reductase (1,5-anhydro-D-mannitol-forming)
MINCAIIGNGKMGKIRKDAIISNGGFVSSMCDPLKNNSSIDLLLGDEEIDAVFICTPNYINKELTIRALESGKHVFCEKPPAFNSDEVLEVIETEKKCVGKLMYGFNHRHHKSIKYIKNAVDNNKYGNILWMRGRYGKSSDKSFFNGWRSKKELSGGGILIDQGIHMLDLFLYIAEDFDEVHSIISNNFWNLEGIEDNVFSIFKNNKTGVAASLHSTMTQWRHLFALEIFFEKGYMVLNGLKTPSGTYGQEILTEATNRSVSPVAIWSSENRMEYSVDESWESEVKYFFGSIKSDSPVTIGSSTDALKLMKIIDRIYDERVD